MLKRFLFLVILSFMLVSVFAQTGIGTTTPDASAKLDVSSTNKGFLPPRVTLTGISDNATIVSPATGLLVYNTGSVGLQAGYYYWNGANWATIATASSAGNGVTAMDMVKLYSKAYSAATADSTIANATGYKFTVPVSGRYLFDFSSSGYLNQATMSITFKVRQGVTDLGTDVFTNANNNVHVVFTGMVEVNLSAGVTYNVFVSSTGSRDAGDYDRVYYKLVAGNLPVTGQSVDYVSVVRTTIQTVNTGDNLLFNTINGGNIPYNSLTGNFSLTAGKTYRLTGSVSLDGSTASSSGIDIAWKTAAGDVLGNRGLTISTSFASTAAGNGVTDIIYTPSINTTVSLNVIAANAGAKTVANYTYANIQQVGSSAIINPWTLSGTDTYNTTGNVGIGTSSPSSSALLDLSATSKGILIPRMTTAQKNAISTPTTGLLIFQTDAPAGFYYYNGSSWLNISNLGTTNRYIPYSSNFAFYTSGQSLTSAASGNNIDLTGSDLEIIVPSGFASNRIVLNWDTWGDLSTTNTAQGSLRYAISQSGTATNAYFSVAMNGWATIATGSMRFATPVSYILNDLAPGTYTFKLRVAREGENGTINSINNYHVAGTGQVYVK